MKRAFILALCGTLLAGCVVVERQDACPGCGPNVLDLSEAGNELICGAPPHTCRVTMQKVEFVSPRLQTDPR